MWWKIHMPGWSKMCNCGSKWVQILSKWDLGLAKSFAWQYIAGTFTKIFCKSGIYHVFLLVTADFHDHSTFVWCGAVAGGCGGCVAKANIHTSPILVRWKWDEYQNLEHSDWLNLCTWCAMSRIPAHLIGGFFARVQQDWIILQVIQARIGQFLSDLSQNWIIFNWDEPCPTHVDPPGCDFWPAWKSHLSGQSSQQHQCHQELFQGISEKDWPFGLAQLLCLVLHLERYFTFNSQQGSWLGFHVAGTQ